MSKLMLLWLVPIAFLPMAFMAMTLPPNDNVILGTSAVDCDGPLSVLMFALPSYGIYGLGLSIHLKHFMCSKFKRHYAGIVVCGLIMLIITPNTVNAFKEHKINKENHTLTCGTGW